jgi:hypothetical protein
MHEKTVDDDISVHLFKCTIDVRIYIHPPPSKSTFGREKNTLDFFRTGIVYTVLEAIFPANFFFPKIDK